MEPRFDVHPYLIYDPPIGVIKMKPIDFECCDFVRFSSMPKMVLHLYNIRKFFNDLNLDMIGDESSLVFLINLIDD